MRSMSLSGIERAVSSCRHCPLWKTAYLAVPGEGPAHARVMLVGQNPGAEEDRTGRPFVGRSGQFLNSVLRETGMNRKELYITSVVKHATPDNRVPNKTEIQACLPFLHEQIETIRPSIILLMGNVARNHTPRYGGIRYIETCHPAAAMRFPKHRDGFRRAFRTLKRLMRTRR